MNEEIDDRLREAAHDYHRPPPTPREEMWARVQARIGENVVPIERARAPRRPSLPWLGIAAAAAMIAIGFALGRSTGPAVPPAGPIAIPVPDESGEPFRVAAEEHLTRSEELLTLVRSDARAGRVDRSVGEWGHTLLARTRLLLDSPAGSDPELRPVLEDLEVLLAQVALLGQGGVVGGRGRDELDMIADGMDAQDMLPRIQAVLPARLGS